MCDIILFGGKNMSYKLIALDVDGTLLNSKKELTSNTIQAIQSAIQKGKEVVISSGRCLPELKDILDKIPEIRYLIMSSGAMVYDLKNHKVIYSNLIDIPTIHKILNISKEHDILVHVLCDQSIVDSNKGHRLKDYQMGVYQPMYDAIATYVDDIYAYVDQLNKPLEKINLYHKNQTDREESAAKLKELNISLKYAEQTSIECSALNVNKGTGLKKLCQYLQIDEKDTICVGDAHNDLEIFEVAGLSIAMGNATKDIQEKANVVVKDNDHEGVAQAIEEYLLCES